MAVAACDGLKYAEGWKDLFPLALADDYTDYQGEANLISHGVVVFSYAHRSGSRPLAELRDRIVNEYPCYKAVRDTAVRLVLRCDDVKQMYSDTYEVDFHLDEERGRVFVLVMWEVPPSEERYRELVGALDRSVRRYKPRGRPRQLQVGSLDWLVDRCCANQFDASARLAEPS
jgi:hypothetical protein